MLFALSSLLALPLNDGGLSVVGLSDAIDPVGVMASICGSLVLVVCGFKQLRNNLNSIKIACLSGRAIPGEFLINKSHGKMP